jgi:peptidoglycan/LPS O-acetylase OafA/YrhL
MHLAGVPDFVIHRENQSLAGAAFSAFALHLNVYEGVTGYLPGGWDVLWSLSIEEVFYLGFPLACLLLRRPAWLVAALVPLALSLPATRAALDGNEIWQEKAYLPGMAAIAAGVLAAIAAARFRVGSVIAIRAIAAAGAAGIAAVLLFEPSLWRMLGNGSLLVLTGSTAVLLFALQAEARLADVRPPRGVGWLLSMGRHSYEIYLTHMFVVFAVAGVFRWSGGDGRLGFLGYPPAIALAWAVGSLFARTVSDPCNRRLRARHFRSRSGA